MKQPTSKSKQQQQQQQQHQTVRICTAIKSDGEHWILLFHIISVNSWSTCFLTELILGFGNCSAATFSNYVIMIEWSFSKNDLTVRFGWTDCHTFVWLICMTVRLGWTVPAIHLSLICVTVRLGWTDCHTFVSYLYDSKAWVDWLPYICLLFVWQ